MTKKQAIAEFKDRLRISAMNKYADLIPEYIEAMQLAISALEKQEKDRWHVVAEEGNPPKMGFYLWSARGGAVEIDFFDGEKWEKATTYLYEVLAWKYRPKAYMEEES